MTPWGEVQRKIFELLCGRVCCAFGAQEDEDADELPQPLWAPLIDGPFTKKDQICVDLRRLQQRCRTTDKTCAEILKTFGKYLGIAAPNNFKCGIKKCDEKIQEAAGAKALRLDGCINCNRTVFLPEDPRKECTLCGQSRYNFKGKPNEVCVHCLCFI